MSGGTTKRRPEWLKVRLRTDAGYRKLRSLVSELNLNTVCAEARCPNIYECWNAGTATFMILGDTCTRRCGFCSVHSGRPAAGVDPHEPRHVGEADSNVGQADAFELERCPRRGVVDDLLEIVLRALDLGDASGLYRGGRACYRCRDERGDERFAPAKTPSQDHLPAVWKDNFRCPNGRSVDHEKRNK